MPPDALDFSAFSGPDPSDTRGVRVVSLRSGPSTALVAVCMGLFVLGVPTLLMLFLIAGNSGARPLGLMYFVLAVIGFFGVPGVMLIDSVRHRNAYPAIPVSRARVREFAKDNGFTYNPVGRFSAVAGLFLSTHGGALVDLV